MFTLKDKNEDDYTDILPIYVYPNQQTRDAIKSNLERSIEKCTKLIKLHSIKVKPKRPKRYRNKRHKEFFEKSEYCEWVDNAYMLMGQSFYYQAKYFQASITFDFVVRKFPKEDVYYEALLWLLRTYNQAGEFEYSKEYIEIIEKSKKFPKKLETDYAVLKSDYYSKTGDYENSIKELRKAVTKINNKPLINKIYPFKKRHNLARYKFVLAQLYEKNGNDKQALNFYISAHKHNSEYDLKFHSKLKMAEMDRSNPQKVYRMLLKMLKNDKNYDYKDRIYYSLGEYARKRKDKKKAVEYYKLASVNCTNNTNLKTKIYLTLANYYLEDKIYRDAGNYFDSTLSVMTEEYPGYADIKSEASNYVNLSKQLFIIEKEDSLLNIASMPKEKQRKWAEEKITKLREKEQLEREREAQLQEDISLHSQNMPYLGNKSKGEWYFYNSYNVETGKSQFKKKWGNRKLEDNWRRSNKSIMNDFAAALDDDESEESDSTKSKVTDKYSVEFYLKDIPSDSASLAKSSAIINNALHIVAFIYQDKIKTNPEAIGTYEQIEKRYPESDLAFVYYNLYKLYSKEGNSSKSLHYKSLLESKYGDTKYAKAVNDPMFVQKQIAMNKITDSLYMNIFGDFAAQNWLGIDSKISEIKQYELPEDLPEKIDFIETITKGQISGVAQLRENINTFISKSKDEELIALAKTILQTLKSGATTRKADIAKLREESKILREDSVRIEKDKLEAKEGYIFKANLPHFYVMIIPRKGIDYNRLKFNVANFNVDYFNRLPIDIEMFEFDKKSLMMYIFKFKGKKSAMEYYNSMIEHENLIFEKVDKIDYIHFVISENNYTRFVSDKFIGEYMEFFIEKYKQ